MIPLFYATCDYEYPGYWTKGKDYPIFKIDLSSTNDHLFLTINDKGKFSTITALEFYRKTKLEKILE